MCEFFVAQPWSKWQVKSECKSITPRLIADAVSFKETNKKARFADTQSEKARSKCSIINYGGDFERSTRHDHKLILRTRAARRKLRSSFFFPFFLNSTNQASGFGAARLHKRAPFNFTRTLPKHEEKEKQQRNILNLERDRKSCVWLAACATPSKFENFASNAMRCDNKKWNCNS